MLIMKALTYLLFVAALGSPEEQIAVALIGSPSSEGASPAAPHGLAPRGEYDACDGTPEINSQVQDVLNSLGAVMKSAETATKDNVNSYVQQVKDLTEKAIAITNAPDFQMDAEGQQFVYDWVIKKGEQAARFLAAAPLPLSDLDNYRATCADHPLYDISSAFFYTKAFGKCYDCDKVLKMNSQICTVNCWLDEQADRTGFAVWVPSFNYHCGVPSPPNCTNIHMPALDLSSLSSDVAASSVDPSTSDIPSTTTDAQALPPIASSVEAFSTTGKSDFVSSGGSGGSSAWRPSASATASAPATIDYGSTIAGTGVFIPTASVTTASFYREISSAIDGLNSVNSDIQKWSSPAGIAAIRNIAGQIARSPGMHIHSADQAVSADAEAETTPSIGQKNAYVNEYGTLLSAVTQLLDSATAKASDLEYFQDGYFRWYIAVLGARVSDLEIQLLVLLDRGDAPCQAVKSFGSLMVSAPSAFTSALSALDGLPLIDIFFPAVPTLGCFATCNHDSGSTQSSASNSASRSASGSVSDNASASASERASASATASATASASNSAPASASGRASEGVSAGASDSASGSAPGSASVSASSDSSSGSASDRVSASASPSASASVSDNASASASEKTYKL